MPLCCSPPHSPSDSFCISGAVHRCMYVLYDLRPLSILLIALRLVRELGSFPGLGSKVMSLIAHCCGIFLWYAMVFHNSFSYGAVMSAAICNASAGLVPVFIAFLVLHFLYAEITSAVVTSNCLGCLCIIDSVMFLLSMLCSASRSPSQMVAIISSYACVSCSVVCAYLPSFVFICCIWPLGFGANCLRSLCLSLIV